jgi:hypothetical protein
MPYTSVTLAQFRTNIKESVDSVPFWQDPEIDNLINEVLRWWNLFTGQWRRVDNLVSTAGEPFYDLTSTLTWSARVTFRDKPLSLASYVSLDYGRTNWQSETGGSGAAGVPSLPTIWAPIGIRTIALWPAPPANGELFTVDGVAETPVLVNPGDFVDLGQDEFNLFFGEVLYLMAYKEAGPRFAASAPYHQDFIKAAMDKNQRLKASAFFRRFTGIDNARGQRPRAAQPDPKQTQSGATR